MPLSVLGHDCFLERTFVVLSIFAFLKPRSCFVYLYGLVLRHKYIWQLWINSELRESSLVHKLTLKQHTVNFSTNSWHCKKDINHSKFFHYSCKLTEIKADSWHLSTILLQLEYAEIQSPKNKKIVLDTWCELFTKNEKHTFQYKLNQHRYDKMHSLYRRHVDMSR